MSRFVQLTESSGKVLRVAFDTVIAIRASRLTIHDEDARLSFIDGSTVVLSNGNHFQVRETPEEVEGCIIDVETEWYVDLNEDTDEEEWAY